MKVKHLAITVAVLAVGAVATAFYKHAQSAPPADPRVGQPILDPAVIPQTTRVVLHAGGNEIVLENTTPAGSAWVDRSYFDLPVDFSKLAGLIQDLRDAKITRFASANPERMERMGFEGEKIELRDASDKALWSVELGRTVSSGGRFLRFAGGDRTYLASTNAWIDSTAKNWADAALVTAKPEEVVGLEVSFPDNGGALHLTRASATAPWTADGLAAGETVKESEVSALLTKLAGLRFSETSDPNAEDAVAAREHARTFKLTLAGGKTYTIDLGRKPAPPAPEKPAADAAAAEKPAEGETPAATPPAPQPGPVYAFVQSSEASDPINSSMQRRAFQIYEWTFTSLPANRAALVQPVGAAPASPPAAAGATPGADGENPPAATPSPTPAPATAPENTAAPAP